MTACKQTASMVAAATATDEADSKSAAKIDAAEERKPSIKCRKGKKAKGKLAGKSNGAEKPKTHDLSDVTRWLAVMSIAQENSEYEELALLVYRDFFYMQSFESVHDKPSLHAVFRKADESWKFLTDSEKAPYLARARVNKVLLARVAEFKKVETTT